MAKINVREKGKNYELKISKLLGGWWGETFRRTPNSGGLHWKNDNRVSGDIVPPVDSLFPYNIECKNHENWHLEQVLKGVGDVESWWEQCIADADNMNKKPFLCFSKNFDANYGMILLDDFLPLSNNNPRLQGMNWFLVAIPGKPPRVLFIVDRFIQVVSKESIIKSYGL